MLPCAFFVVGCFEAMLWHRARMGKYPLIVRQWCSETLPAHSPSISVWHPPWQDAPKMWRPEIAFDNSQETPDIIAQVRACVGSMSLCSLDSVSVCTCSLAYHACDHVRIHDHYSHWLLITYLHSHWLLITYLHSHWPLITYLRSHWLLITYLHSHWLLITYLHSHWPLITYLHSHWSMITQTVPQCTNKSLHLYRTRTRYKGLYQTANKLIQSKPVARDPTTKRVCMRDVRDHESVMSVMPVGCLDALIFSRACA